MMDYPKVYNKISERLANSELQLAAFKISLVVAPTFAAAEDDAPLIECAAKIEASTPATPAGI